MRKQVKPDDPIELMSVDDVCQYTLMSKSSLNKRSRNPDDDFPAPEWLGRKRVWRAKVIREYVFNALTTERPEHHLAGGRAPGNPATVAPAPVADNLDSLTFGEPDHPRSERVRKK